METTSNIILSILTPVFNGSAYLKSCLENVCQQIQPGIEHWIIDGGSEDGSIEILEDYSARYPHLNWVSEKDKGQSDAMNKAIRLAKGQWISFLNVDDYYEAGALASVLKLISQNPNRECLFVGNLNIWNPDGSLHSVNRSNRITIPRLLADLCEWPYNPSAYFYPKSVHEKIGYFPENEHYAMDYDFILKVATSGIPVEYHDETWGNFRLLPEAKTSQDQQSNQSYLRAKALRDRHFQILPLKQKLEVHWLKLKWFLTLKWRRIFPKASE